MTRLFLQAQEFNAAMISMAASFRAFGMTLEGVKLSSAVSLVQCSVCGMVWAHFQTYELFGEQLCRRCYVREIAP